MIYSSCIQYLDIMRAHVRTTHGCAEPPRLRNQQQIHRVLFAHVSCKPGVAQKNIPKHGMMKNVQPLDTCAYIQECILCNVPHDGMGHETPCIILWKKARNVERNR